jgi:hypothetical protein
MRGVTQVQQFLARPASLHPTRKDVIVLVVLYHCATLFQRFQSSRADQQWTEAGLIDHRSMKLWALVVGGVSFTPL